LLTAGFSIDELLAALEGVTLDSLRSFQSELLTQAEVQALPFYLPALTYPGLP
jgi:hypothetical protein